MNLKMEAIILFEATVLIILQNATSPKEAIRDPVLCKFLYIPVIEHGMYGIEPS